VALTPRQSRFVAEYLTDLNAKAAAIRAGYRESGAQVAGSRLLSNVKVSQAIAEALERRATRVEVKADDILRELLRLATTDIGKAFDVNGNLLPLHQIPEETRRAIAGVEATSKDDGSTVTKVKFWDKTKGLELLGKHLKLFTDKVEHSADASLESLILAARAKK
jgi:phage terminase small subunit